MVIKTFSKDPAAKLDYLFDWSAWLPSGDTISTSSWAIDPPVPDGSLAIAGSPAPSNTTTTTTAWLTGGTLGQKYILRNRVVTVGGRTEDKSAAVVVEDH
jgi:hypothetical protein